MTRDNLYKHYIYVKNYVSLRLPEVNQKLRDIRRSLVRKYGYTFDELIDECKQLHERDAAHLKIQNQLKITTKVRDDMIKENIMLKKQLNQTRLINENEVKFIDESKNKMN